MTLSTMKDLLVAQLNELYAAEVHSADVLPKLAEKASDPELARILEKHAAETDEHISRLHGVFDDVGVRPPAARAESEGMKGLFEDCMRLANMPKAEPHVRDAALIAVAQHVEHDEIAGYGCARTWAQLLGFDKAASNLQETLDEERQADTDLSELAESLNKAAVAGTGS